MIKATAKIRCEEFVMLESSLKPCSSLRSTARERGRNGYAVIIKVRSEAALGGKMLPEGLFCLDPVQLDCAVVAKGILFDLV